VSTTAKLLRQRREAIGLSQRELGRKLNMTATFINRIEKGLSPLPPEQVSEFAKVLNCSTKELSWAIKMDASERFEKKIK